MKYCWPASWLRRCGSRLPLLLAALGETLAERGGVINLGIEGAMLAGALGGTLGATAGGLWFGALGAAAAERVFGQILAIK